MPTSTGKGSRYTHRGQRPFAPDTSASQSHHASPVMKSVCCTQKGGKKVTFKCRYNVHFFIRSSLSATDMACSSFAQGTVTKSLPWFMTLNHPIPIVWSGWAALEHPWPHQGWGSIPVPTERTRSCYCSANRAALPPCSYQAQLCGERENSMVCLTCRILIKVTK